MAMLKKGGQARFVIENFKNVDSVTIPAGYMLTDVLVKKSGTTAGNIKLGNYVAPVKEIITVVVTGAPTASGNITVSLRGETVLVPVLGTESIAQTVTKITSASYSTWVAVESLGTTITFTAKEAGAKTGTTTVTGPTGFTRTGPTVGTPGANATSGEQTVASTALSEVNGNVSALTLVKRIYDTDTTIYLGVSSLATGDIAFHIKKLM